MVSSLGSGGGATNAPATPTSLLVVQPKVSPADIRIVLADAEANEAEVEFLFASPATGGVPQRLTRIAQNPVRLATSREGQEQRIAWDFANEPGIGTTSLSRGVRLFARIANGVNQDTVVDLGNDAPVVVPEAVSVPEVTGVVPLAVQLSDSSSDISTLKVEYRIVGEAEDAWRLARAGGLAASEPTPSVALTNLEATQAPGLRVLFFWDSAYVGSVGDSRFEPQLPGKEREVVFRFTAADGVATALPVTTAPFRVDNNARPTAQINDGFVQASSDRHRTIPVPVTVFDEESDRVDVVLQWRRSIDPDFEDLGTTDAATLRNLLEDATYRRDKQIAKIGELTVGGRGELVDARHLRTSVLALDGAWALTQGLAGKELELLRPVNAPPVTVSSGWSTANISQPVAILPIGMGVEAVVLQDTGGHARVDVLDVQTGAVRPLAAGIAGTPTAMCWSARENTVLVATQATSGWIVCEVVVSGDASVPVVQRAIQPPGPGSNALLGIAARSVTSALATSGDQLLQIDWAGGTPRAVSLMRGMSEPHGLVLDPCDRDTVLIAERTFPGGTGNGRVARWNLRTRTPQAFLAVANVPVRPSAMATDPTGNMLFVLSEPIGGGKVLRRYRTNYSVGAAGQLAYALPADATCFGVGQTGAWVAASKSSATVVAHGGASHRRTFVGYDPSTMRIELDADLVGAGPLVEWRIAHAKGKGVLGAPEGRTEVVLWDSSGLAGLDGIQLRAIALDSEIGTLGTESSPISALREVQTASANFVEAIADLDADGDLDLLTGANVLTQSEPRQFSSAPLQASSPFVIDWNRDGRNDIIPLGGAPTALVQAAGGSFSATLLPTNGDAVNLIADLDQNGHADVVTTGATCTVRFRLGVDTYGAPISVDIGQVPQPALATVGDINADGLLDLVFARQWTTYADNSLFPVLAAVQSNGGFLPAAPIGIATNSSDRIRVADVDANGHADIVLGHPLLSSGATGVFVPANVTIHLQQQDGFRPPIIWNREGQGAVLSFLTDLNDDGLIDVVGRRGGLMQIKPGYFVPMGYAFVAQGVGVSGGFSDYSRLEDVDGDGNVDAVLDGTMHLSHMPGLRLSSSIAIPGIVLGELSGDLQEDVGSVDPSSGQGTIVGLHVQRGFLEFPTTPDRAFSRFSDVSPDSRLLAADIDGSGVPSFVSYMVTDSGAILRSGWSPFNDVNLLPGFFNAVIGEFGLEDLDRDGRLDACATVGTGFFQPKFNFWRRGSGQPASWQLGVSVSLDQVPSPVYRGIQFSDVNRDGFPDVVCGFSNNSMLVFLVGPSGLPQLPGSVVQVGASSSGAVRVGDWDNDGFGDVAFGANVFWGGAQGLSSPLVFDLHLSVGCADLDGDRLLDLAAFGACYKQVAPRVFVKFPNPDSASGLPASAYGWNALRDIDHDGEPDINGTSLTLGDR